MQDVTTNNVVVWRRFAAVLMVMPAGLAPALYISMVGFYAHNFQSSIYFIGMIFALYLPYPLLPLIQHHLDSFFDEPFSTKTTYYFRVVGVQLILAIVGLTWMLVPQSPRVVMGIGVTLGIFVSANISSCHQLCAAMDPQLPQFAMIGEQLGAVLPLIIFAYLGFGAESSLLKFKIALSVVPAVCTFVAIVISYLHFHTDLFEVAYEHLAYKDDEDETNYYASEQPDFRLALSRQISEKVPNYISEQAVPSPTDLLADTLTPRDGVPSWIWTWMTAVGFMSALDGFTLSLVPFFGDPGMAQQLALMKLAMNFLGKLSAIPISSMTCFQHGPLHQLMAFLVTSYGLLALVLVAKLAKFKVETHVFLLSWCLFTAWYRFSCSLAIVTMLTYVKIQYRKLVARSNLIAALTNVLLGVILALVVVYFSDGLNGTWPPMDRVIS